MTAALTISANLEWLVNGYRRALTRFDATADQRDPEERFIPLFETLNWAVAIVFPERGRGLRIQDDTVLGLKFARNRVHHQWADALDPRDAPNPMGLVVRAGAGPKIMGPPTVLDWFWKPLNRLPKAPPRHQHGKSEYHDHLAGNSVRHSLAHLDTLLPRKRDT